MMFDSSKDAAKKESFATGFGCWFTFHYGKTKTKTADAFGNPRLLPKFPPLRLALDHEKALSVG
jgi:hypothetical protein